ncbi:hypothetical protein DDB_G0269660 [Dictyostelium discoideum AX4]|uniref:Uncharacterized protein n=1 Tax=Dictyostelium discoideum TaxID=44689 RepID=Q55DH2_DICDI|nr:hypothetical protein DDB_G0269660 [Dictyostelium discoideum AX4]EAL72180.1 hypothetical protein DDB_G0269660 [Dictyostelium discoideum AX4]|eukprot:XP_646159.1 hypothetical protein DDB_G0269660 [Dictyostelium discoideum AX4]
MIWRDHSLFGVIKQLSEKGAEETMKLEACNSGIWQPDPMPRKHGYTNNTSEKKTTRTALHI